MMVKVRDEGKSMFEQWVFYIMFVGFVISGSTGYVMHIRPRDDASLSGELLIVIFVVALSVGVGSLTVLLLATGDFLGR